MNALRSTLVDSDFVLNHKALKNEASAENTAFNRNMGRERGRERERVNHLFAAEFNGLTLLYYFFELFDFVI